MQCSISKAHKASQNDSIVTLLNLAPLTYSLKKPPEAPSTEQRTQTFFFFQLSDFLNRTDSWLIKVAHRMLQLSAEPSITAKRLNFQIYSQNLRVLVLSMIWTSILIISYSMKHLWEGLSGIFHPPTFHSKALVRHTKPKRVIKSHAGVKFLKILKILWLSAIRSHYFPQRTRWLYWLYINYHWLI